MLSRSGVSHGLDGSGVGGSIGHQSTSMRALARRRTSMGERHKDLGNSDVCEPSCPTHFIRVLSRASLKKSQKIF